MNEPDHYAVLGVGRTASQAQIARAFRLANFGIGVDPAQME